ncbi:MAG TPA: hypothetical protein DDW50_11950 [Firmicutes bacterium]|nr:hypothetical protein [Bacillota bacterium]
MSLNFKGLPAFFYFHGSLKGGCLSEMGPFTLQSLRPGRLIRSVFRSDNFAKFTHDRLMTLPRIPLIDFSRS